MIFVPLVVLNNILKIQKDLLKNKVLIVKLLLVS